MNLKTDTPSLSPPCAKRPSDWFDPHQQIRTRRQCLRCPQLSDCAATALRNRPNYGMWAGVWIEGDLETKQHLLGRASPALSCATTAAHPAPEAHCSAASPMAPPSTRPRSRRQLVGRLHTQLPDPQITAVITARASGHCEIFAAGCTYQQSAIVLRRRRRPATTTLGSPAEAIAACRNCIEQIEHTEVPTALDLGYLVDPRSPASGAPMLWRQHHWVYLDTRGHLYPCPNPHSSGIA
ncbi:Transcriptional regulator WhiB [Mycobacterium kansasii]|uniref:WhiB family transcriptional regulator n=1 Tax=Mycobacterium kansasii TaxID=1768 RepID=UPI000F297CBB|nr:WhiB family transcriptional regulator [Mycobacterium kansasii]VAZ69653.1 Transcriptional regulator WhiB [Mycobacterium kansasii]